MANWQHAFEQFVNRIQTTGQLWSLSCDDGWVVCESTEFEDAEVMPFWSDEATASRHCTEQWADYQVTRISLQDFVELWLPNLLEDDVLVGPDWNDELEGLEVEPADIAEALMEASNEG
ncbi:DUF2750 domain-containing protein [Gallaecimonas sp. GXIMD1310]|uniref:DUF2750 domain-containing protein n=1 Tax=Gallaecimonas sp. GXIMD1310 TaxID=3131926 RepID=UPI00324FAF52